MRYQLTIFALGAALAATPALAQINVGVGGQAGGNVGVGVGVPGGVVGGVTDTVGRTVNSVDRTVNRTLSSDLRVATSADLRAGVTIRDRNGNKVGTVQSVHGNMAVVVKGDRSFHVPLARLYRGASGLVTDLTRSQIRAMASANAKVGAHLHN